MNRQLLTSAILALAIAAPVAVCASTTQDESEIRSVAAARQQDAWNRHDAKAYANLFAEDGDVVNVVGWWWKTRSEIESKLADAFKFVFRDSILTMGAVHIKFLTPDIAVAHVSWTMSGAKTPPGLPEPREGIQTLVLQKTRGTWLIAAFQNTDSVPERPFPTGPPATPAAKAPGNEAER